MNTLVNSYLNIIYSEEVHFESMGYWTHGYVGYLFPQPSSHGKKEGTFFHDFLPSVMLLFSTGSQLKVKHPQHKMFTIVSQMNHFYFYLQVFCRVETTLIDTNFWDKAIQSRHMHCFFLQVFRFRFFYKYLVEIIKYLHFRIAKFKALF